MIKTDNLLRPNVKLVGEETELGMMWLVKATEKLDGKVDLIFDKLQLKSLVELSIAAELFKEREIYKRAEEEVRFPPG